MSSRWLRKAALVAVAGWLAGCGTSAQSPDLFVVTRTGPAGTLVMLVNDSGTIRCDGGPTRPMSDPLLLAARDVADSLGQVISAGKRYGGAPGIYRFSFRLSGGTLAFPDLAAAGNPDLGHAEQFVLQAAQGPCRGARGA